MCGLVIARSFFKFDELMNLNRYRGGLYHSVSLVRQGKISIDRVVGPYSPGSIPGEFGELIIGHQQAPTGNTKTDANIHPSFYRGSYLWHNGMIKEVQMVANRWFGWDTDYLHTAIVEGGYPELEHVDGSFACFRWTGLDKLHIFRNEIVPLYIGDGNVSSTEFPGSSLIEPNVVFDYDISTGFIAPIGRFKNTENPYLL